MNRDLSHWDRRSRHSLKLWREWEDDLQAAQTLRKLSSTNRQMSLYEEGILQAEEAFKILERVGSAVQ